MYQLKWITWPFSLRIRKTHTHTHAQHTSKSKVHTNPPKSLVPMASGKLYAGSNMSLLLQNERLPCSSEVLESLWAHTSNPASFQGDGWFISLPSQFPSLSSYFFFLLLLPLLMNFHYLNFSVTCIHTYLPRFLKNGLSHNIKLLVVSMTIFWKDRHRNLKPWYIYIKINKLTNWLFFFYGKLESWFRSV